MFNKVFCIDDDNTTLTICKLVIAKSGFAREVITAMNGREGIGFFEANAGNKEALPDIVFLDLNMPVMNGWDFLEEYAARYAEKLPDIKIVILSSTVNPEDFKKAARLSIVNDFISKPISVEALRELNGRLTGR
jgi:CheY-like chemotaxis protein